VKEISKACPLWLVKWRRTRQNKSICTHDHNVPPINSVTFSSIRCLSSPSSFSSYLRSIHSLTQNPFLCHAVITPSWSHMMLWFCIE